MVMRLVHSATGTYHTFNCERAVSFMHGKDSMAGFFNVFQPIKNYMSSISIKLTCWFIVIDLYAIEQRTFHLIFKLMLIFSLQRMSSFYVQRSALKRTTIDKWLCEPSWFNQQGLNSKAFFYRWSDWSRFLRFSSHKIIPTLVFSENFDSTFGTRSKLAPNYSNFVPFFVWFQAKKSFFNSSVAK